MGKTFKANDPYSRSKKFKFNNRRQKKKKSYVEKFEFKKPESELDNAKLHRH